MNMNFMNGTGGGGIRTIVPHPTPPISIIKIKFLKPKSSLFGRGSQRFSLIADGDGARLTATTCNRRQDNIMCMCSESRSRGLVTELGSGTTQWFTKQGTAQSHGEWRLFLSILCSLQPEQHLAATTSITPIQIVFNNVPMHIYSLRRPNLCEEKQKVTKSASHSGYAWVHLSL